MGPVLLFRGEIASLDAMSAGHLTRSVAPAGNRLERQRVPMRWCRSQKPAKSATSVFPVAAGCHPAGLGQRMTGSSVPRCCGSPSSRYVNKCRRAAVRKRGRQLASGPCGFLIFCRVRMRMITIINRSPMPSRRQCFANLRWLHGEAHKQRLPRAH
jgi:hypothetical protein